MVAKNATGMGISIIMLNPMFALIINSCASDGIVTAPVPVVTAPVLFHCKLLFTKYTKSYINYQVNIFRNCLKIEPEVGSMKANVKITILLREVRLSKGWTLMQLEYFSGVSRSHIAAVETGRRMPTIYVLCSLAIALEVKVEDLYTYEVE